VSGHHSWQEVKEELYRKMDAEKRQTFTLDVVKLKAVMSHLRWECQLEDWLAYALDRVAEGWPWLTFQVWLYREQQRNDHLFTSWPGVTVLGERERPNESE